jgi:HSP20 family molecular chaperone IbpA
MHDPNDDENRPDDRREDRSDDDRSDEPSTTLGAGLQALSDLLAALGGGDETRARGPFDADRPSVEYRYSVRTGLDDGSAGDPDGPGLSRRPAGPRTKRRPTPAVPSSVDREGDETIVTVDLQGFDPDDVSVGVVGRNLVVTADGREVGRFPVDLPPSRTTNARLNNGVLEVRIRPAGSETDE